MNKQQRRSEGESESSPGLKRQIADVIRNTVMQKITTVQELAEQNQGEIDDIWAALEEKDEEIQMLKEMNAAMAGLAESEETTAKKRRRDLLVALQRKAQGNAGKAEMDYNEVLEQWRILGHESVDKTLYPKQAYREMENLSALAGVTYMDAQRPKAVRINMEEFDASTAFEGFDNVNNFEEAQATKNAVSHGD